MEISPAQIRAARALLRLEQSELADHASVSVVTVRRRSEARPDAEARFAALRAISVWSAEKLRGRDLLTEADLYNEDGLPA